MARVNSDLVGKYVNIASRCAVFINRKFGGRLAAARQDFAFSAKAGEIAALYEQREFGKALREIMALADAADRKSTRLNSSHSQISYAVFCLKKKNNPTTHRSL